MSSSSDSLPRFFLKPIDINGDVIDVLTYTGPEADAKAAAAAVTCLASVEDAVAWVLDTASPTGWKNNYNHHRVDQGGSELALMKFTGRKSL